MINKLLEKISKHGIISIFIVFFFIFLFFLDLKNIFFKCGDGYWILLTGQWIIDNCQIPHTNILGGNFEELTQISFTAYQWLFEVIFALIYKLLNFHGIVFGIYFIFISTLFAWTDALYKRGFKGFLEILFTLAILEPILFLFVDLRPYTVSVFFGAILSLLLLHIQKNHIKNIVIPLVFILWANMHLSFIFGLVWLLVEALFEIKEEKKYDLVKIFIISSLCTLINPYGINLYHYLYTLAIGSNMNSNIIELGSINFHTFSYLLFLYPIAILSFAISFKTKTIRSAEKVMFLIACMMSLYSLRHLAFFLYFLPFFLANSVKYYLIKYNLFKSQRKLFIRKNEKIALSLISCFIIGILLSAFKLFPYEPPMKNLTKESIEYINKINNDGLILTDDTTSSELLFYTDKKAFIDSRFDMYGDKYFNRYTKILPSKPDWYKHFKKEKNIDCIIYKVDNKFKKRFIKDLPTDKWKQTYTDDNIVIWLKNNKG